MAEFYLDAHRTRTVKPDADMFSMHTHSTYEMFVFLEGAAQYFVEGMVYSLNAGDILLLKKSEAHSLLINRPVPYERVVIHFSSEAIGEAYRDRLCAFLDDRPLGTGNKYSGVHAPAGWQGYIDRIVASEDPREKSLYLTVLLHELSEASPENSSLPQASNRGVAEVIRYINDHLTEGIHLDDLCRLFYTSKSQLNRRFRQSVGTTVWDYISTKRLLLARDLLQNGEKPTQVFHQCGFSDYCAFFKAYKAKFGQSPKSDRGRSERSVPSRGI